MRGISKAVIVTAMISFFSLTYLTWSELLLRIFLAMAFGMLLGLDRDIKNKPIDFRAYMIVCVTSCVVAILGQELYAEFSQAEEIISIDLGKIIAGVLTGIGFLGAGAIIHQDDNRVVGTATGASIWAAGGIGLALGFGYYNLALAAFIAIGIILVGGGIFMAKFQGKNDKEDR